MKSSLAIIDYILLVSTLLLSLGVGLYYAVFKKQNTTKEYLQGGKNMNFLGIGLSIGASMVSGVTMIALPTYAYYYGIQQGLQVSVLAVPITYCFTYFFISPVFFNLQLTSIFTYMELRYDARVMKLTSGLYALPMFLYAITITYATALTIAQMTSIDVQILSAVITVTCIIYTIFGGFKAIIWTDAFQVIIMLASITTVCGVAVQQTGGIKNVVEKALDSGRLTIDFNIDPTKKDTFLATFCGGLSQLTMMFTFNQGNVQRITSIKNYKDVKYAYVLSAILWMSMAGLSVFTGVVAIARYMFCDPLSLKKIEKPDQILSYITLDTGNAIPAFLGIFMSGIISGGLSSLSTTFNSLAATLYIDFIKPALSNNFREKYEVLTIKLIVLTVGVFTIGLVYVMPHLGDVLTVILVISAIAYAPLIGTFTSGLFIPSVNAKGAFWSGITTIIFMGWLIGTTQWYTLKGLIKHPTLPVYTNACQVINYSPTPTFLTNSTLYSSDEVPSIYRLSHHYYPIVGSLVSITAAVIISFLTKDKNHQVREDLLSPILGHIRRRKWTNKAYNTVEMAAVVTDTAVGNNI